jgi:L-fucose mutarotase
MLKHIHPLIGPELLAALARMGHGDTLAVVDVNYPAYAAGVPVVRLDGVDVVTAVDAILTLLPIDDFEPEPIARMAVVGDPDAVPPVACEVGDVVERVEGRQVRVRVVDRPDFYAEARQASVVVATGETRAYGCFLLTKGVIRS